MWRVAVAGHPRLVGDGHDRSWHAGSHWHRKYILLSSKGVRVHRIRHRGTDGGGRQMVERARETGRRRQEKNVPFPPPSGPPNCIPPPGKPPPKNILKSSSGLTSFSNRIPPPPPADRKDGIPEERDSGSPPCESKAARKFESERTWNAFETTTRPDVS